MSPNRAPDRPAPHAALRTRLIPALGLCAVATLVLAEFGTRGPADTTAQMEQLAGRIERVEVLHPDAARQIGQVMDLPQYDCARVSCSAGLQNRNQAARERLKQSIASKTHWGEAVAVGHTDN